MEQTHSFLSRRKLIVALGGIATATAAIMMTPFRATIALTARDVVRRQPALRSMLLTLADARYEEWQDQVGSIFTIAGGASLKLVSVTAFNTVGDRPSGLGRDRAFVAHFDVQNGVTVAGDLIYNAVHASYGAFRIFLSESSDPRLPYRMTALFN